MGYNLSFLFHLPVLPSSPSPPLMKPMQLLSTRKRNNSKRNARRSPAKSGNYTKHLLGHRHVHVLYQFTEML